MRDRGEPLAIDIKGRTLADSVRTSRTLGRVTSTPELWMAAPAADSAPPSAPPSTSEASRWAFKGNRLRCSSCASRSSRTAPAASMKAAVARRPRSFSSLRSLRAHARPVVIAVRTSALRCSSTSRVACRKDTSCASLSRIASLSA
eukprot:scaffold178405_cov30-Tisochrysis_lutea.AAC.6